LFQPEGGALTIQDILPVLAWNSRHHAAHITELRKRMGWLTAEQKSNIVRTTEENMATMAENLGRRWFEEVWNRGRREPARGN